LGLRKPFFAAATGPSLWLSVVGNGLLVLVVVLVVVVVMLLLLVAGTAADWVAVMGPVQG
jgi:uncharacterized membrane protein